MRALAAILARHRATVLALYGAQLGAALIVTVAAGWALSAVVGRQPLFDVALRGDLTALAQALKGRTDVLAALACTGAAVALAWMIVSWYLGAGLLGVLSGRAFGEAAGTAFFAFGRLFLWTLLPGAAGVLAAAIGLATLGQALASTPTAAGLAGKLAVALAPGALILGVTSVWVDHARALLVGERRRDAGRTLLEAARLTLRRPRAFGHYLAYLGAWAGVTLLYVLCTMGSPFAGIAGAIVLLALRQLVLFLRFAFRVALSAAQVALVTERTPPA